MAIETRKIQEIGKVGEAQVSPKAPLFRRMAAFVRLKLAGTALSRKEQERLDKLLIEKCRMGGGPEVKRLLKAGARIEAQHEGGFTPLFFAIHGGSRHLAKELIELGADVSTPIDGTTPLMLAAQDGRTEIAKMLLDAGADIHFKDEDFGRTALFVARQHRNKDIASLLVSSGATE